MHLPPAVLLHIFQMMKRRSPFDLSADRTLPKLALVSKSWLAVARDLLYTSVYLGNERLPRSARRLLRTLAGSPALAARVHAIYFGSHYMHRTETAHLAQIVALCGPLRLQTLHIWGWNGFELAELRAAMRGAAHLQELQLNRHALTDTECDPFCTGPEFFEMLQSWPALRRLRLFRRVLLDDDGDAGARAVLPEFAYLHDRDNFYGKDLLTLAARAPRARTLILRASVVTSPSGLAALQQWAPTLTQLTLSGEPFSASTPDLAAVLGGMPALLALELSAQCVPPSAFDSATAFQALEDLKYEVRRDTDDLAVLTRILAAGPLRLPALRDVWIQHPVSYTGFARAEHFAEGVYEAFKRVCRDRGIRLKEAHESEAESWAAEYGLPVEMFLDEFAVKADYVNSEGGEGAASSGEEEGEDDEDDEDEDEDEDEEDEEDGDDENEEA